MESGEGHDWFALSSPATLMLHPCPNCGAELGVAGDAASCPECDIEYVWVIGSGWMTHEAVEDSTNHHDSRAELDARLSAAAQTGG